MTRRLQYADGSWIELPDEWLGKHANRRDETIANLPDGTGATQTNFTVAMVLLEDWNIEGLNGNPDKWDFDKLSLPLIAWINSTVIGDYNKCYEVKKNYSGTSPNG